MKSISIKNIVWFSAIAFIIISTLFGCNSKVAPSSVVYATDDDPIIYATPHDITFNRANELPNATFFTNRFSQKEINRLKLDTALLAPNEYIFLLDDIVLHNDTLPSSVKCYFHFMNGDHIEKVLRVERKNSFTEHVLCMSGWAAGDYKMNSQFANNGRFIETLVTKENTDIEPGSPYRVDSVITVYACTPALKFTLLRADSFTLYRTMPDPFYNIIFGNLNGYELTYDCSECTQSLSGNITVNATKDGTKQMLFEITMASDYLSDITILPLIGEKFLYVETGHTSGNSEYYLYHIDSLTLASYMLQVDNSALETVPKNIRNNIFKSVSMVRSLDGEFFYESHYSTDNGEGNIYGTYELMRNSSGKYIIRLGKLEWERD